MAPAKTTPPPVDDTPPTGPEGQAFFKARAQELEKELAKLRAEHAAATDPTQKPPKDTHVLVLANGDQVRTFAPVATQHTDDDGNVWPVVSCFELPREED